MAGGPLGAGQRPSVSRGRRNTEADQAATEDLIGD
jgi:hypothetical protein